MTSEELELLTDICDFTTLFFVILRHKSNERFDVSLGCYYTMYEVEVWLESYIESDLGMRLSLSQFCFLQTLFQV